MKISLHSNVGRRRESNQDYADYFINQAGQVLFVLCDGVGGHQAGDVASQLTTQFLGQAFEAIDQPLDSEAIVDWYGTIIHEVNHYIYDKSLQEEGLEGMGTTLVMAALIDEVVHIAHVGDSRAYVYYRHQLTQITEDHSLVNELIRIGEITAEEALVHPRRNVVTQSIGGSDSVEYELNRVKREDIDILMLCSDGLSNMLAPVTLLQYFTKGEALIPLGTDLVEGANEAGGTDNITLILVSELEQKTVEAAHYGERSYPKKIGQATAHLPQNKSIDEAHESSNKTEGSAGEKLIEGIKTLFTSKDSDEANQEDRVTEETQALRDTKEQAAADGEEVELDGRNRG